MSYNKDYKCPRCGEWREIFGLLSSFNLNYYCDSCAKPSTIPEWLKASKAAPAEKRVPEAGEIAGLEEAIVWQPIETAKKSHGSKILCYGEGYVFEAECEFDDGHGAWCSIGGATPTHWMSLPQSPQLTVLQAVDEVGGE